jgi:hypothetical protein
MLLLIIYFKNRSLLIEGIVKIVFGIPAEVSPAEIE